MDFLSNYSITKLLNYQISLCLCDSVVQQAFSMLVSPNLCQRKSSILKLRLRC